MYEADEPTGNAEPLPGQLAFPGPAPRRPRWRRRLLVAGLALVGLGLVAAGAGAGYLAWVNKERADRWQARAEILEANVEALDEVVLARTQDLNERTEELNRMASKVKRAEGALARSEADVKNLERRQRQLANEKAQVEDARAELALEAAVLEEVASAYVTCKNGLAELLNYVLADDYFSAAEIVEGVRVDCDSADGQLSNYLGSYG